VTFHAQLIAHIYVELTDQGETHKLFASLRRPRVSASIVAAPSVSLHVGGARAKLVSSRVEIQPHADGTAHARTVELLFENMPPEGLTATFEEFLRWLRELHEASGWIFSRFIAYDFSHAGDQEADETARLLGHRVRAVQTAEGVVIPEESGR
tara:strand:+ start:4333 stop:4791 length:459 start_codon:yes stop_codon:yes gene_type:complete